MEIFAYTMDNFLLHYIVSIGSIYFVFTYE